MDGANGFESSSCAPRIKEQVIRLRLAPIARRPSGEQLCSEFLNGRLSRGKDCLPLHLRKLKSSHYLFEGWHYRVVDDAIMFLTHVHTISMRKKCYTAMGLMALQKAHRAHQVLQHQPEGQAEK